MLVPSRIRRAAREVLGLPQWPLKRPVEIRTLEEQIYAAVLRPGDFAIDVGANRGSVSIFIARCIGPTGKVIAFEPVWPMFEQLCENIQRDRFLKSVILPCPLGIAETWKQARIEVPGSDYERGSLAPRETWKQTQDGAALHSYDCTFVALGRFLAERRLPLPHFIKIDVEGAERFVLEGAQELLGNDQPPFMLLEVFAPWERAFAYTPWNLLSYLESFGYEFLFVCPEGIVDHSPSEAAPFPPEFVNGYNVLAYRNKHHSERIASLSHLRIGGPGPVLPMVLADRPNA